MNTLLSEENEEYLEDNIDINKKNISNKKSNKIVKYFRGIWIYFKDYILFLKGNTIKVFKMINYATYHWGFQMILALGMLQSYAAVNVMAEQLSPHLVKEGEIE